MLPNYFYNNNYQIVQTKDHVMIMTEMVHDARVIRMGGTAASAEAACVRGWAIPSAAGKATRWSSRRPTSIRCSSIRGASENLKVTERFTRTGPDTIVYRFTVEDPTDVHGAVDRRSCRSTGSTSMIYEYACHEGNYALVEHPRRRARQGKARDRAEEAAVDRDSAIDADRRCRARRR